MKLETDLYSMLFVTTMFSDYIYDCDEKKEKDEEDMKVLIDKEKAKGKEKQGDEQSELNMTRQNQESFEF